jgi:RHS repeat-associated protein
VTRSYAYDGEDILRETAGSAAVKYVHGPGIDEPLASEDGGGVLSHLHADGLGSVVKVTSSTGTVTLTRQYDAWGNMQVGQSTAGYAFTGREWDAETKVYYYRARYYDPTVGRFTSEDPLRFSGGVNFYTYVEDSPTTFIDPSGLARKRPKHWKFRTRTCNREELMACEAMCGDRGVESCMVPQTFRPNRYKDGLIGWSWVDGPMSCSCNEPDEPFCRRNPNTCAAVVAVAVCVLVTTPWPDDILLPPILLAVP